MKNQKSLIYQTLTNEEQKLLGIYFNEYNEIFQNILLQPPGEFIQNLIKRVDLTIRKKINEFSNTTKVNVENFFNQQIYSREYKYASMALKSIEKKLINQPDLKPFDGKIIEHCNLDKKDNKYIHFCGNNFYVYKYKSIIQYNLRNNNNSNKEEEEEKNDIEIMLVCPYCEMVYKSDLIKFHCNETGQDFYSKIIKNENSELPFATWKKYHCRALINDTLKCEKCNESFYFDKELNILTCNKCNKVYNPMDLEWECLICKKKFKSEAKEYNNLEFKNIKICVKDTILNRIRAKPEYLNCDCENVDLKTLKFFHKESCKGDIFLGEMNGKKIVVCNKCESLGIYDNYVWTCPICLKRFKTKNSKKMLSEKKFQTTNSNNSESKEEDEKENENKKNDKLIKNNSINILENQETEKNEQNSKKQLITQSTRDLILLSPKKKEEVSEQSSETKILNEASNSAKHFHNRNNSNNSVSHLITISRQNSLNKLKTPKSNYLNINNNDYMTEVSNKSNKENVVPIRSVKSMKKNDIPTPIRNQTSFGLKRMQSSRSPFVALKQNLSNKFKNVEIENIDKIGNIVREHHSGDLYKNDNRVSKDINLNNIDIKINKNQSVSTATGSEKSGTNNSEENNSNNIAKKASSNIIKSSINKVNIPLPNSNNNITKNKIYNNKNNNSINNNNNNNSNNNINQNYIQKNYYYHHQHSHSKSNSSQNLVNLKEKEFEVNDYIIKSQIGEGSFGKIFLVEGPDHKLYALKKIVAATKKDIQSLQHEYEILLDVGKCEKKINLVKIFGIQTKQLDPTTFVMYVLMELAQTDWEKEIIHRQRKRLFYTEQELLILLYDLVKTFAQLQRINISHRDIKPQNILVFKGRHGYKLADFGEAKELVADPTNKQTLRGTELYMSPILFHALRARKVQKYINHNVFKSDVFSLGYCALFAAALTFEALYDIRELNNNYQIKMILEKYLKKHYSNKLIDVIAIMLEVDEKNRCDFIELEKVFENLNLED